jgi:hypothetical protein
MLIRAHALLHQASRLKDDQDRVIATIEDYMAVRELIADIVAEGVDVTVKPEIRELVEAVGKLLKEGREEVCQIGLRAPLRLDKSSVSRRVNAAIDSGYLKNLEERKGRTARLVLGDPLADDLELLPKPEKLRGRLHGCAVDVGDSTGPVPSSPESWPDETLREVPSKWQGQI